MDWSIVIPTHNRLPTLRLVLQAWDRQTEAADLEVIVVDDGSTDGTRDWLPSWRPESYRWRFAHQANAGPAAARNRALAMARGAYVLFTGDDIEPRPDLLQQHRLAHRALADPRVAVLGLTRWPEGSPTTATMRHIDGPGAQQFSYHFFEDGAEYDFRHLYTSNISLDRRLLDLEPRGFCLDFPAAAFEDAELGFRLAAHGLRIVYRAAAVAEHHHPYTARGFFRRQVRCGEMAAILYRLLPELRRFLDLDTVEAARTHLARRRLRGLPLPTVAEEAERRLSSVAAFFDPLPFDEAGEILAPLFRYAYLLGLTRSWYPETAARSIRELLATKILLPAARNFLRTIAARGLPHPGLDLEILAAATTS